MNKKITCFKNREWFVMNHDIPFDVSNLEIGFKIKKRLYSGKSAFQKIDFAELHFFGKALFLDGIIQTSEKDEFIYHEMLVQVPLLLHKNPKKVLIIGGGDGGSLEETLKHPIEKVWMVEIDKKVADLCQKYLPSISKGAFNNKKAEVIFGDGKEFMKQHENFFDVIILDLSDPGGPAIQLISENFYKDVKRALAKGGIVSIQSGSFSYQPDLVGGIFKRIKKIFPYAEIRKSVVPVYVAGEFSFTIGSKTDLKKVSEKEIESKIKKLRLNLRYLDPKVISTTKLMPMSLSGLLK